MVQTTPVTNSQNTTQDGRLRCISWVLQPNETTTVTRNPTWPIMLYDIFICLLFQHDAPKSSILGGLLASYFQHYMYDWRFFCSVTPSYTTWRKMELPFQTMWVWRFSHPTIFPPLFLAWELHLCDSPSLQILVHGRTLIQNGRDRKRGMLVVLRCSVQSAHLGPTKVK